MKNAMKYISDIVESISGRVTSKIEKFKDLDILHKVVLGYAIWFIYDSFKLDDESETKENETIVNTTEVV